MREPAASLRGPSSNAKRLTATVQSTNSCSSVPAVILGPSLPGVSLTWKRVDGVSGPD
jgi:hypothetical protein